MSFIPTRRLYAPPAAVGAIVTTVLRNVDVQNWVTALLAALVAFAFRVLAIRQRWRLLLVYGWIGLPIGA